ncbi:MAG: hypothetical protein HC789_18730 [Microcoleus sp. CSU_2_2]|nr:hypothetical protein [Microcoleus sp. SU_5_3]NJS12260.1 hypothetical protein [Microcoleus sp. CSU_2_2]
MRLQTDIRTSQLQSNQASVASAQAWCRLADRPPTPKFAPSTWVKLLNPPTAFSFDEAWLLCQYSEQKWLAWIPDYGEILLSTDEFYIAT